MFVSGPRERIRPRRPAGVRRAIGGLRRALVLHVAALMLIGAFPVLTVAQEDGSQPAHPATAVQPVMGLQFPDGFTEELVVEGLVDPTTFAFLPDGRILFAEK